ncbi:MAG: BatD family protein, partial [Bacteroidaceae bacterium]|nr:BatD family protein [Bacteroidaceae bacterium]
PDQVNANDAATLRLVVSGQGNMKLMKAPKVSFPKDFEIYDPKEDNKTVMSASGSKGNVVFDYVVVPRHGGRYSVPPVEFVYFDPDDASYKTLRTDSFHIAVARGKESHSVQTHSQEDLKVLSSDIHYIKGGGPKLKSQSVTFFMTQTFWGAYTACLLAFVMLLAIFFRKAKENANIAGMRRKRAGKAAAKRLKVAAKLLKAHDAGAFYDETLRALIGYAGDKLSLPTAELSKERISEEMLSRGVDEALVKRYIRVMDDCEFARFAPGNPEETMDKLFAEATDVINEME